MNAHIFNLSTIRLGHIFVFFKPKWGCKIPEEPHIGALIHVVRKFAFSDSYWCLSRKWYETGHSCYESLISQLPLSICVSSNDLEWPWKVGCGCKAQFSGWSLCITLYCLINSDQSDSDSNPCGEGRISRESATSPSKGVGPQCSQILRDPYTCPRGLI